jgi:hypothetical protein
MMPFHPGLKANALGYRHAVSNLLEASVRPRQDVMDAEEAQFAVLASPGAALTGEQRVALASAARNGYATDQLQTFARHLYTEPSTVHEEHVRAAADVVGDPATVEAIGIVARLSSVDRLHDVLNVDPEPLPQPRPGEPTGRITDALKRRRGFLPKPPGEIPSTLDLVPQEGDALRAMFGPMYMTEHEMGDPLFHREPGLNTPQLETVAARISLLNRCFY